MNGGPGCASKIGLAQELGPWVLSLFGNYNQDSELIPNSFSWLNLTNLLFIDGPAGVGYSVNNDPDFVYNDKNVAQDNLDALVSFFTDKFPEYRSELNALYIAGESYAGKYIPDLAFMIGNYNALNQDTALNLKGIILGNPAMYFKDGSLEDSEI
jgi:carboxypeptidase C (cathepsin A)